MNIGAKRLGVVLVGATCLTLYSSVFASTCVTGKADVQRYMDYFSRALRAHDPAHAEQGEVLAREALTGQTADLQEAIDRGVVNPDTVFHLGGINDVPLLALAILGCQDYTARALINAGADVNGTATFRPIAVAASNGDAVIAAFLLQHGAPIDSVDSSGHMPLEIAVRQRQLSTVKLFLAHDSHPNRRLAGGGTILDLVAPSDDPGDLAIANELRSHGVKSSLERKSN